MRAALVRQSDGYVANIIGYDPEGTYQPPVGHSIVPDPTGAARIGGTWDGATTFSPPPPYVPTAHEVEEADADLNLRQSYQALRQWADDAAVVAAQGGNVTQAQLKATIGRLGQMCDGIADLLVVLRRR